MIGAVGSEMKPVWVEPSDYANGQGSSLDGENHCRSKLDS